MAHHNTGYLPEDMETYDGFEVFDHGVWAGDVSPKDTVDGDEE